MSAVVSIARRELRGFFDHATAYVLAVAFLGVSLFLSLRSIYAVGSADLRSFFSLLPWLYCVFIPAVTMRSLSEERSRGTFEWLAAQPLTEVQLLAGKFLGAWLFTLAVLAGTLPMSLGVLWIADAPAGPVLAQYIGAALLAALFVAIGLLASSSTRNQITAFILAATLCFALVLAGLRFTVMALSPPWSTVVSALSVLPHFESVARGVVDLRDVLYFLTFGGVFLLFAYVVVMRDRLSLARGGYRRLRIGTLAATLAVVFLNLLGGRIHGRLDLTEDGLYTLSDGTRDLLEGLNDLVTLKLFVSENLPAEIQVTLRDVRDLVADYRRVSDGNVRVVEVHPDEDEDAREEATASGIQEVQFNVMREDEFEVRSGWLGLSLQFADERKTIPFVGRTDDLEYKLTSAIASMTAERQPRVTFLTGFGALSGFQLPELQSMLGDRYDVRSANLETDPVPLLSPDSTDLVAIVGPKQPLSEEAVAAIDTYLDAGGSGLFLLEATQPSQEMPLSQPISSGLEALVSERGITLASNMVYDLRSNQTVSLGRQSIFNIVAPYPLWPIGLPAGGEDRHPVTADLEMLALGWAAPLDVDTAVARPLWTTTESGGRQPAMTGLDPETPIEPDPLTLSVQVLAAAATPEESGRLIVVGDADFASSRFIQSSPQNLLFVANAVDWLAQDESLIEIRSKDRTPPPLVFESEVTRAALRWGNLLGVPLLFVLVGVLRSLRRGQKARELKTAVLASGGAP